MRRIAAARAVHPLRSPQGRPQPPVRGPIEPIPTFTPQPRSTAFSRRQVPPTSRSTTAAAIDTSSDGEAVRVAAANDGHRACASRCSGGPRMSRGCTSTVQGAFAMSARRRHIPIHSMGSHSRSTQGEFRVRTRALFTVMQIVDSSSASWRGRTCPGACGGAPQIVADVSVVSLPGAGPLAAIDSAQPITADSVLGSRDRARAIAGTGARPITCPRRRLADYVIPIATAAATSMLRGRS